MWFAKQIGGCGEVCVGVVVRSCGQVCVCGEVCVGRWVWGVGCGCGEGCVVRCVWGGECGCVGVGRWV